jgi:hypothetical protein
MRHFSKFCQYGICCDRVNCGLGVHDKDNDEFVGVIWLCGYHAAIDPLDLDVPFTAFEQLVSALPRRGPISQEQANALLGFIRHATR